MMAESGTLVMGTPASVVNAEYKEPSDIANTSSSRVYLFGAVVLLKGLRRKIR